MIDDDEDDDDDDDEDDKLFSGMVDRRKMFSLISIWDQIYPPLGTSDTPQVGFEPAQDPGCRVQT